MCRNACGPLPVGGCPVRLHRPVVLSGRKLVAPAAPGAPEAGPRLFRNLSLPPAPAALVRHTGGSELCHGLAELPSGSSFRAVLSPLRDPLPSVPRLQNGVCLVVHLTGAKPVYP